MAIVIAQRSMLLAAFSIIYPSITLQGQTNYAVDFTNYGDCDIKLCVRLDETGNNCANSFTVNCQLLAHGNTINYSFTVPAGYEFCGYEMHQDPYPAGGTIIVTGTDPCEWSFINSDLCNTGGAPEIACKGDCEEARCIIHP